MSTWKLLCVMLLLIGVCFSAEKVKEKFPRQKDDTSLTRIKARPLSVHDNRTIICGYVKISDYYNYVYSNWQLTFQSLKFIEAAENFGEYSGEEAHLYLPREHAWSAIDQIIETSEKKGLKIVRAEVIIRGSETPWNMLECIDLQFYDLEKKAWGPWMIQTAKEAAEKKQLERAKLEEEKKMAQEKAAADMKTAEAQKKEAEKQKAKDARKSDEKLASSRLKTAKVIFAKDKTSGKRKLKEIIDDHPNTESAKEAQKLLDSAG